MKTRYLISGVFLFINVVILFFNNEKLPAQVKINSINKSMNGTVIKMNSFVLFVEKIKVSKDFYQSIFNLKVKSESPSYLQFEGGITLWDRARAINTIYKT